MHHFWKRIEGFENVLELYDIFKDEPFFFILDSSQFNQQRGRYSFIGFDPFDKVIESGPNALGLLKEKYSQYAYKGGMEIVPFASGAVGYLSYDIGLYLENIKRKNLQESLLPECFFCFYDLILAIDHYKKILYVIANGLPEKEPHARIMRAINRVEYVLDKVESKSRNKIINSTKSENNEGLVDQFSVNSNFLKSDYYHAVKVALDHIRRGDVYQVNLSQRFDYQFKKEIDHSRIYKLLREASPSPFGAYMNFGGFQILSSSPERFLEVKEGVLQSRPMKGTRPRSKDAFKDEQLRREITESTKDQAELLMITDLMRNDLGRVCKYGTVKVKILREIEEYKTVFQATSLVQGHLDEKRDVFDCLRACFPGGSITGCPKIRSMEIIDALEPNHRGIYTGSLGYMTFSGNMDFNILIRTMLVHEKEISFHVGGGIVSDSTPEGEYQETLVKAQAMMDIIRDYSRQEREDSSLSLSSQ